MNAIDWYKKVINQYSDFDGRARRTEYWYFFLINFIISLILMLIGEGIGFYYLDSIYALAVLLPSIAVAVRRVHDVGKSGWFILIPIYNLILMLTEGDAGPNQYGPDPKNPHPGFDFENNN